MYNFIKGVVPGAYQPYQTTSVFCFKLQYFIHRLMHGISSSIGQKLSNQAMRAKICGNYPQKIKS